MTFGQIKTITENYLISSYGDSDKFKTAMSEFRKDVLENKDISRIYSLYEDLSTPQGLTEEDAQEYINEGVRLIQSFLKKVNIPKTKIDKSLNNYKEIDSLVYVNENFTNLKDVVENKKKVINLLKQPKKQITESVKIPISSMMSIANKNLKNYFDSLDESSKKELSEILNEDRKSLKSKFNSLKQESISKLNKIRETETGETKEKINETIQRIENEKFDNLNFFKLKKLFESL